MNMFPPASLFSACTLKTKVMVAGFGGGCRLGNLRWKTAEFRRFLLSVLINFPVERMTQCKKRRRVFSWRCFDKWRAGQGLLDLRFAQGTLRCEAVSTAPHLPAICPVWHHLESLGQNLMSALPSLRAKVSVWKQTLFLFENDISQVFIQANPHEGRKGKERD